MPVYNRLVSFPFTLCQDPEAEVVDVPVVERRQAGSAAQTAVVVLDEPAEQVAEQVAEVALVECLWEVELATK